MPGLGGIGFSGGFLGGLANAMNARRQERIQREDRSQKNAQQAIKFLLDSGQVKDVADLGPIFDHAFGFDQQQGKKGKGKNGVDPREAVSAMLNHAIQGERGQPLLPGPAAMTPDATPSASGVMTGPNPELPSTPLSIPAQRPTEPAPRTLGGVSLLTPEQAMQRQVTQQVQQEQAMVEAKVALARRILPTLQSLDSSATLDDALATVGIRTPRSAGVPSFSEIPGEVVDETGKATPMSGILDHRTGQILDPITRQPMPGFRHRTTTGSASLGVYAERAAREMGFATANEAAQAGMMGEVNSRAQEMQAAAAGASTTARGEAASKAPLSAAQRFDALRNLQGDWRKADAPFKETKRQLQIMETGLKRFQEGDKNGGSQAVLVTFQKILDPNSVVRESEYDRSPEGVGLKQRIAGFIERLQSGGAGVPEAELEHMVQTAREFVDGMASYDDLERDRITSAAKEAGLDPSRVFGVAAVEPTKKKTSNAAPTAKKDANGNWVIQVP